MKKIIYILFVAFMLLCYKTNAQSLKKIVDSQNLKMTEFELVSSDIENTVLKFTLKDYNFKEVQTVKNVIGKIIISENGIPLQIEQSPDIIKFVTSIIIPDEAGMITNIIASDFNDYSNIDIAPSKGNLLRTVDPSTVAYQYGSDYSKNNFFPGSLCDLGTPYIIRDFRGQVLNVYPFQYNPVTKVLRVYNSITIKVSKKDNNGSNKFIRTKQIPAIDDEYSKIYSQHFINYAKSPFYTPLGEHGKMLILCYNSFMQAMQPFVNWKRTIGIPTEIVDVSTIGTTASVIKTYVTNYYNTNGLTFLLLVGDAAQIPTNNLSSSGPSDNAYGYISGSDSYQEFFVGRFSAETVTEVQTQVQRTINYEKTPSATPGVYSKCIGIGSDLGPGDDNEYDYQHIRNILTSMTGFTYTSKAELYDGSQGGSDAAGDPTASMLATEINNGAGVIAYTGHGSQTSFVTTNFSNSDVANLTNTNVFPFIWSVACVEGSFVNGTCFAESWLRATKNGQPSGAIAVLMSTINQSWNPPMEGQDEMADILVETYSNNIKRTFGGISVNGLFKMNDTYGSSGTTMTDTWTCFGDPSVMVRTANPATMTVTHQPTINLGATQMVVTCNVNGALIALTINNQIIGTAYVSGGSATITFNALMQIDTITVAATAFNYIPYIGAVPIMSSVQNDAAPMTIVEPQSSYSCAGISVTPKVVIGNIGINNLTSLNVACKYNNGAAITQAWTGNLASFQTDTIIFPAIILNTGNHTIKFITSQPNGVTDANPVNDSAKRNITVQNLSITSDFIADDTNFCTTPAIVQFTNQSTNAQTYLWDFGDGSTSTAQNPQHTYSNLGAYTVALTASAGVCGSDTTTNTAYIVVGATPPVVTSAMLCGAGTATLHATAPGIIAWFNTPTGGNIINTGTTFVTPVISATTTYYVQDSVSAPSQYVGEKNDTTDGSMYTYSYSNYLIFDCIAPVTLLSVEVNAGSSGNRTIELQNSSGTVLQTTTVNIPYGRSRINLNFNIPVGTDLRLTGPISPNLFRNYSGISFPYELPGFISITGSSAGTNYYYYFYDWEVKQGTCVSARVPVTAYVNNTSPTADFTYTVNGLSANFTDQSTNTAIYNWNFGDGTTSNSVNPTHSYALGGTYSVKLIIKNGCGSDSITKQINIVGIKDYLQENVFMIYPNPANDNITIEKSSSEKNAILSIYSINSQLVLQKQLLLNKTSIDISYIDKGMYFIEVKTEDGISVKKFVKE